MTNELNNIICILDENGNRISRKYYYKSLVENISYGNIDFKETIPITFKLKWAICLYNFLQKNHFKPQVFQIARANPDDAANLYKAFYKKLAYENIF